MRACEAAPDYQRFHERSFALRTRAGLASALLKALYAMVLSSGIQAEAQVLVEPKDRVPRLALVVGVPSYNHYDDRPSMELDAREISKTVTDAGFTYLREPRDTRYGSLILEFRALRQQLDAADQTAIVFFYFGGHGFSKDGYEFLVPSDANPADLVGSSISLDYVLDTIFPRRGGALIVVLNKCRTTAPSGSEMSVVPRTARAARREAPQSSPMNDAWTNSKSLADLVIQYSTRPNSSARAKLTANESLSPYGLAFSLLAPARDKELQRVLLEVQLHVKQLTSLRSGQQPQLPELSRPLGLGELYLFPTADTWARDRDSWERVRNNAVASDLEGFVREHPDSQFLSTALELLAGLGQEVRP